MIRVYICSLKNPLWRVQSALRHAHEIEKRSREAMRWGWDDVRKKEKSERKRREGASRVEVLITPCKKNNAMDSKRHKLLLEAGIKWIHSGDRTRDEDRMAKLRSAKGNRPLLTNETRIRLWVKTRLYRALKRFKSCYSDERYDCLRVTFHWYR